MNRKLYIFSLICFLGFNNAKAQDAYSGPSSDLGFHEFFTFAWDVNIPTGDKFIDETSYAGGKLEYRKVVGYNLSVGFDLSWSSYYEYTPYKTYQYNSNTDVTTDLYKYNYTLPMAVTLHKYFPSGGIVIPYAGLGVGATYSSPSLIFNIYELSYDNWGFLIRPELGALIKFGEASDVGLLVGARYNLSTNNEESLNIESIESIGLQLGIAWTY